MAGILKSNSLRSLVRPGARLLASKSGSSLSFEKALLNVPETNVTALSNGFRVASETTSSETATIGLWIEGGSRSENPSNNGISHLLEQVNRKGEDFENLGGELKSNTSREQTVYYAKVLKQDVPKAVEILSEIAQGSSFQADKLEKKRAALLKQFENPSEGTQEMMFDHLHATAYQGGSLGQTVLGLEENVRRFSVQDLQSFKKENYNASRIVLASAGGIDHEQLVKLAEKAFGGLSAESGEASRKTSRFVGSEIRLRDDEQHDAHAVFAVEGASKSSPDYFPLQVAKFLLGSWDRSLGGGKNLSSRLAQNIAQYGLCTSYNSFNISYSDTGLFGFYFLSDNVGRLDDVMFQFQNEWVRICVSASEIEIERAKNQLKAALLMQLNGTDSVCQDIGRQVLAYGRRMTPFELNARIDAIDAATVRGVAYKYLYDKDPADRKSVV